VKEIMVPVSPGELIDKITILRLKAERIADAGKLVNVRHELAVLETAAEGVPRGVIAAMEAELQEINAALWDIEDAIREADARGDFGEAFVALAQAVYRTNDRRAEVKKRINLALGSVIVEEKSYASHGG
jgi:Family of unknown function (DUF6165)